MEWAAQAQPSCHCPLVTRAQQNLWAMIPPPPVERDGRVTVRVMCRWKTTKPATALLRRVLPIRSAPCSAPYGQPVPRAGLVSAQVASAWPIPPVFVGVAAPGGEHVLVVNAAREPDAPMAIPCRVRADPPETMRRPPCASRPPPSPRRRIPTVRHVPGRPGFLHRRPDPSRDDRRCRWYAALGRPCPVRYPRGVPASQERRVGHLNVQSRLFRYCVRLFRSRSSGLGALCPPWRTGLSAIGGRCGGANVQPGKAASFAAGNFATGRDRPNAL